MSSQIVLQVARTIAFGDVLRELSEDELRALYQRYIEPGGPMAGFVARNLMHWANLRWQWSSDLGFVRGVWLNAGQADPVGLLLAPAPLSKAEKRAKAQAAKRWNQKSVSGWKPYQTRRIAGTREMKLLKAA